MALADARRAFRAGVADSLDAGVPASVGRARIRTAVENRCIPLERAGSW
jgi:hypothetical protein